ncbi:MAG: tRNA (adenosine(37)-N6)-threonylcarbamoyltransferase complex dimerization subunit type 1 TsaB [Alphaproteobacteria bacterium]|nr:tRNA (adenosine(37)-N6)-threonylcarbamoyltransferase complex dimerization subunit type 1 TsaB [Alphaproteobacteria bacterium]
MYILAFDTTAESCSICLKKNDVEVAKFIKRMEFGQAEVLLPEIKKLLDSIKIKFSDLGLIVVCVGPGSFTGVRASLSAARAFTIANKKMPVTGVSAFEAYLYALAQDELCAHNAVILETKRADFYYQLFNEKREKINEASAMSREDIIRELQNKKVTLIGDGVERFLATPTGLSLHAIKIEFYPPIEKLASCGVQKLNEGLIDFPKPMYLRAPEVYSRS